SPRDLRQDVHVAVGADRLKESVLVDLPVDGDRGARLQVRQQVGVFLAEPGKELAHGGGFDVDLRHAAGELAQVADQGDVGHAFVHSLSPRAGRGGSQIFAVPLARASSSAFSTLGGDIGRSVKRMPVALATALATAAMGGTMGVSPTPRTP